jgi:hypothetical protein
MGRLATLGTSVLLFWVLASSIACDIQGGDNKDSGIELGEQ